MSPAPKRGEWSTGDVGAPTGAVRQITIVPLK